MKSAPLVKALVCGLLEDDGRVLFLKKIENGLEKIELPSIIVPSGRSEFAQIKEKFFLMTGIDGQVGDIIFQSTYNAGTRKRKNLVPCLVFRISARTKRAKPSEEFSGFVWLKISDVIKLKKTKKLEWLNYLTSLNLKP